MLDIYSIGDLNYLVTILNSIAAWGGTSNPGQFAAVGGMIGIFVIAGQSVISGRAPQFQNFLVAVLFYWFLMGPGVGVTVHDVYSGGTRNVNNVPLGVAVIGSVMSTVGFSITENMEQMFTTPRMSSCFSGSSTSGAECGFLSGVRHMGVPAIDMYLPGIYTLPAAQQGDVRKTIGNYIQDCTYTGIVLEQMKMDDILRNTDPWAAVGFNSTIFGTQTYIPGTDPVGGTSRTCLDAHTQIGNYLNGTDFWNHIQPTIQSTMGITGNPYTQLQSELDNMLVETGGAAGTENAYRVYMAKILGHFFGASINAETLLKHNINTGDITLAVAKAQRNEQWRGEKRLFQTTIRPALTFFEGLFYALTPFMAIMVMIVPFGIKMIIRYLQTAVWIQCWMPMMAIVNLFGYMAYYKEFEALSTTSFSASSLYGVVAVQSAASEWIAQADLLGSMVPALAMAVVYGTSVTLTHMAAQLRGGDHYSEKDLKPDLMRNNAMFDYDMYRGFRGYGADNVVPTIGFGNELLQSEQSGLAEKNAATRTYTSAVGQVQSQSASQTLTSSELTSLGEQVSAMNSESSAYVRNVASAINKSLSGTDTTNHNLVGLLSAGGGWSTLAEARATLTQTYGELSADQVQAAVNAAESVAGTSDIRAGLTEAITHDHREQNASVLSATVGETTDATLRDSASQMVAAEDSYAQTSQQRTAFSQTVSNSLLEIGRTAAAGGYLAHLGALAAKHGISEGHIQSSAQDLQSRYYIGSEEARASAIVQALDTKSNGGNIAAGNDLVNVVSGMHGLTPASAMGSPSANAGTSGDVRVSGGKAQTAAGGVNAPSQKVDVANINAATAPSQAPTALNVYQTNAANQEQVRSGGTVMMAQQNKDTSQIPLDMMSKRLQTRNYAEGAYQHLHKRVGFIGNMVDGLGAQIEHMENSPVMPHTAGIGLLRGIKGAFEAGYDQFQKAAEVGYETTQGQQHVEAAAQAMQAEFEKMKNGGLLDKADGAIGVVAEGAKSYYHQLNAALQSGQFSEIFSSAGTAMAQPYAQSMDNMWSGIKDLTSNTFDTETIHANTLQEAKTAGLVGEQAELFANVRTAALSFSHDPTYNPAELSRDFAWDLNGLKEHSWQVNEDGSRQMNDTVARTIINAAATGVTGNLSMVRGYNQTQTRGL